MRFSELKKRSESVPSYDQEAILSLADRAQKGEDGAMEELALALLPGFCSKYGFQMGCDAESEELLENCFQRYLKLLGSFDFREGGESFFNRLSWHFRQARGSHGRTCKEGLRTASGRQMKTEGYC